MVIVHCDQDAEPGNGDADGDYGECKPMLKLIAEERNYQRECERGGPRGHGVQLSLDGIVSICLNDSRGEEGVAVCGDEQAEVHKAAEENFEIFEDIDNIADADGALGGASTLVFA